MNVSYASASNKWYELCVLTSDNGTKLFATAAGQSDDLEAAACGLLATGAPPKCRHLARQGWGTRHAGFRARANHSPSR